MPFVTYRYADELFLEAHQRLLSQSIRYRLMKIYLALVVPLVVPSVVQLGIGEWWVTLAVGLPGAGLVFALVFLYLPRAQQWQALRIFRQSPIRGKMIEIDLREDGYHATNPLATVDLNWAAFTKVVHFRDGFLLFQSPQFANWIPVRYLEDPDSLPELQKLLRDNIHEHKIVAPVELEDAERWH